MFAVHLYQHTPTALVFVRTIAAGLTQHDARRLAQQTTDDYRAIADLAPSAR